jgi:hypothetical protein
MLHIPHPPALVRKGLLSVLFSSLLSLPAGCASNGFRETYQSSLERWPSGEVSRLVPRRGDVAILTSSNVERDEIRMMENGYLLLGRSRFQSPEIDPGAARSVATDLGASLVLVKTEYARTVEDAQPVERWVNVHGDPSRSSTGAPSTRAMLGEFRTTYVRTPVSYYESAATFWAKSKPPIFGVLVEGTGQRTTSSDSYGAPTTGRGVVVRAVIVESPAAKAGIVRDDVIVSFGGTTITDPDQFFDTVVADKGRDVEVDVVHAARAQVVSHRVRLRDE